jgi:hypothetical protein
MFRVADPGTKPSHRDAYQTDFVAVWSSSAYSDAHFQAIVDAIGPSVELDEVRVFACRYRSARLCIFKRRFAKVIVVGA